MSGDIQVGQLYLETLLNSNIESITEIRLEGNSMWFEENENNVELLGEFISKQTCIQHLNLGQNKFSSNATLTILTRIADHPSTSSSLKTLNLDLAANFDADETVEKLADILQSASCLSKCNIKNQWCDRKVKVEIEYASDEGMGCIVLLNQATQ